MARPKKALTTIGQVAAKAVKKENPFLVAIKKNLIADESWVTAVLIDAENRTSASGLSIALYRFEIVRPLVHRGRQVAFAIHEKLDLSLEILAERFPNVNWLDAMDTYQAIGGEPVRLHIAVDPPRTDDQGNEYEARNRVMSVYPQTQREAKGAQTVESSEAAE